MTRAAVLCAVVLFATLATAVKITRFKSHEQKRDDSVGLTAQEAAAANLSWIIHVQCGLDWDAVTRMQDILDASAALSATTGGSLGVPCSLVFIAQGLQQTVLVVTCTTTDDAIGDRLPGLLRSSVPAGECGQTLEVARDRVVTNSSSTTQTISQAGLYNLDRTDQRNLPLNGRYTYALDGTGVVVYHLDTGCRPTHEQFTGRATQILNVIGDGQNDCHGTFSLMFYLRTISSVQSRPRDAHSWNSRGRRFWHCKERHARVPESTRLHRRRHIQRRYCCIDGSGRSSDCVAALGSGDHVACWRI